MSSAYSALSHTLVDNRPEDQAFGPRSVLPTHEASQPHAQLDPPLYSNHLSPSHSSQPHHSSTSASPSLNTGNYNTPADSIATTLSAQYQPSDLTEVDDDPFFGADFGNPDDGTPSFLDDQLLGLSNTGDGITDTFSGFHAGLSHNASQPRPQHLLSPDLTPSLRATSPQAAGRQSGSVAPEPVVHSVSPQQLARQPEPIPVLGNYTADVSQLTPDTSNSNRSSEDGGVPGNMAAPPQSPQVTVSFWARNTASQPSTQGPFHQAEMELEPERLSPTTVRGELSAENDHTAPAQTSFNDPSETHDEDGVRFADPFTGQRGLDPDHRSAAAVPSVNELASRRAANERNSHVDAWLSRSVNPDPPNMPPKIDTSSLTDDDGIPEHEIEPGHETENKQLPGQTYYLETGGALTQEDIDLMHQNRNWADAPILFPISRAGAPIYQPQTSQQAISKFEQMCRDNDSIVSRAATWGTRRRSLPSISDIEGVTSGNFLKKLSLSKGDTRRPSILKELRGLVRKPSTSQLLKRTRSGQEDEVEKFPELRSDRREPSSGSRAPVSRSQSGKKATPSVNTALVSMGSNAASIATTHARSGSIAGPLTSPKSPSSRLNVKNALRRPRSKSDLPKDQGGASNSQSNLFDMWRKTGGPPVPSLANPGAALDVEDDDDEDDELYEDPDMKIGANKAIDDITPNFAGFREHILKLAPLLAHEHSYLVDRMAHQQNVRYKALLNARLKHLQQTRNGPCSCRHLCMLQGGSAVILDTKGDADAGDPLSAHLDGSDGDTTPLEGAITQESFPSDIPMPPAHVLPAEFECQLCYQGKKFQKPSDWTKHVHEDVQPFTCTWEKCRDPKIFKRKADWVRHENEGHRHLEWWTCDVDDCRHMCFRRDNFLQHLVREHKFPEPKVKTKAAIKRNPQMDATWQKVERCHKETPQIPQDEPCRFCGKTFPTWKKLTVHLAKHMEQISLPVLRLVQRKELDIDTIISPVQDPPPRSFAALQISPPVKAEPPSYTSTPNLNQAPPFGHQAHPLAYPAAAPGGYMYPMVSQPGSFQPQFYGGEQQYDGLSREFEVASRLEMPQVTHGYPTANAHTYQSIPVTTTGYMAGPNNYVSGPPGMQPFPAAQMNPLGLYDGPAVTVDGMIFPPVSDSEHFTSQGSASPYNRSPHQGAEGFYSQ